MKTIERVQPPTHRALFAAGALAMLVTGCGGGGSSRTASSATHTITTSAHCRTLTEGAVDDAARLLRAYAGSATPGDLYFYDMRQALGSAQLDGCRPAAVGQAFLNGFTERRFRMLLTHLPAAYGRDLRQAEACAQGRRPASGCRRAAAVIEPPGTGKSGGTSEPMTP